MIKNKKHLKQINRSTQAEHHISLRKRAGHLNFGFIDHLIVFTGPLIPIAVFAQSYNVWILGKSEGLSVFTWTLMSFASITMATYALYHRTKPLMFTYIPLVVANLSVVVGIIIDRL
jgi:hypothetical protein